MKKGRVIIYTLLLVIIISLVGCEEKDDRQKIDLKGGKLELGDTTVLFPENSVNEPISVSLKKEALKNKAEVSELLSELSVLSLDKTCNKPVSIKIKLPSGADSKAVMIGLGIKEETSGKLRINFRYIDTAINNGYAEASFTPADYAMADQQANASKSLFYNPFGTAVYAAENEFIVYAGIFESSAYYKNGGHFKIYFPGNIPSAEIEKFMVELEETYALMQAKGYRYEKRTVWPMEVYIKSISDEGVYLESSLKNMIYGKSPNHGWIEISSRFFTDKAERILGTKPTVVHEWFHFVQANYSTKGNTSLWIDEATSTYFEWIESKALPAPVTLNWPKVFSGIVPKTVTQQEGYARFLFIDYLAEKYGENFILEMYQSISKGDNPELALQQATGPYNEWAESGFVNLFSGRFIPIDPFGIYNGILMNQPPASDIGQPFNLVLPEKVQVDKMNSRGEPVVLGEMSLTLNSYGARLLAITLDSKTISALNDSMQLLIRDIAGKEVTSLALMKCSNGKSTLVSTSHTFVTSTDLKNLFIQNEKLLLLVTDTYGFGGPVSLKAELIMSPKLDELIGDYRKANLLIEKVFISDAVRKKIIDKEFDSFTNGDFFKNSCDAEMLAQVEKMPGTNIPVIVHIEKTGEDTGNFWYENADPKASQTKIQKLPFTYLNGVMKFSASLESVYLSGSVHASFGDQQNIVLAGKLNFGMTGMIDEIYVELALDAQKPMPVKK